MITQPKQQVITIAFSTFLAAFSLAAIINFTDPGQSSPVTFVFFYLSLLLFCLGCFTLLGLGLRQWLLPGRYVKNLGNSFRQALLLALLIVISFVLLAQRLLFWWVELTLVLFFAAVEIFLNVQI